jgi:thiol-disulfide isomerase/thioredoxin
MIFVFVCIWEGIQIKDDTDLVVAHFTIKLNYAEGSWSLVDGKGGPESLALLLCCLECTATFGSSSRPTPSPLRFTEMSYFLPHLPSGWHVDEAIKSEEDRVVVLRFGHDWDSQCMTMDETLYAVAEKVQNFAVIYLVDITDVPDFNKVCQM